MMLESVLLVGKPNQLILLANVSSFDTLDGNGMFRVGTGTVHFPCQH